MNMVRRWPLPLFAVVVLCVSAFASGPASSITGSFQTPTGGAVVNGTLTFTLSQPAIVSGTASLVPNQVSCYTTSGGNVVGIPDPLVAPVVSTNTSSGTLAGGTYYLKLTYTGAGGESLPSPEAIVVLTATGSLIINAPLVQPASATGYKVYIGTSSGGETLQGTVVGFASQYTQSSTLSAGSSLPSSNSSSCFIYFSDVLIPTGTAYVVNLVNQNGTQFAGFPQSWCTYGGASGTINISNGAPTGNCGFNGVYYPSPVLQVPPGNPSQSVSGPFQVSGLATLNNLNGIYYVDGVHYPLTAAGVNQAISDASNGNVGGTVIVAKGNYSFSGTITKPRRVFLDFSGSTVTYTGSTQAIVSCDNQILSGTGVYYDGGIENLQLIGPGTGGTTAGIYAGGDPAGIICPTNAVHAQQLWENVVVVGFAYGVEYGTTAFLSTVLNSVFEGNGIGIYYPTAAGASETITYLGSTANNNQTCGIQNDSGAEITWVGGGIDYNGQATSASGPAVCGAVAGTFGSMRFTSTHMEQTSGMIVNLGSGSGQVEFICTGCRLALTGTSGTTTQAINIAGTSSLNDVIFRDTTLGVGAGQTLTYFLTWAATNGLLDIQNLYCGNGTCPSQANQVHVTGTLNTIGNGTSVGTTTLGKVGVGGGFPAQTTPLQITAVSDTTAFIGLQISDLTSGHGAFEQFTDNNTYNTALGADPSTGDLVLYDGRFPSHAGTERFRINRTTGAVSDTVAFTGNTVALTADWTCGTTGTVSSCASATIIGSGGGVPMTLTLPLVAQSYTLECDGVVGQASGDTANNWNLLTASNGATSVTAFYDMYTATTAKAGGATTDQGSTTTTFNIGPTWTLGGTGSKMPFHIFARIQGVPASGTVLSVQLVAPTPGDLVTIYQGMTCRLY